MIPRLHLPVSERTAEPLLVTGDEHHYLQRVLRARDGDPVQLFDGRGYRSDRRVQSIAAHQTQISAGPWHVGLAPAAPEVTLIQGLATSEKMDWAIEKMIELGASSIRPVTTGRSLARLDGARARTRLEHWQRLAIAACRQCGRDALPKITIVAPLTSYLLDLDPLEAPVGCETPVQLARLILCAPQDGTVTPSLSQWARSNNPASLSEIELLVGPESGLTPEEIHLAGQKGFEPVRLGQFTLRTETAGAAALAALAVLTRRD